MKNILLYLMIFFLLFSCNKKNIKLKEIQINKLNVNFGLTHYQFGYKLKETLNIPDSRIAMSDSILLIYNPADSSIGKKTKIQLWEKGKIINNNQNFDTLKQQFYLKEISMSQFIEQKNDSVSNNICLKSEKFSIVRKLKNNVILKFNNVKLKNDSILYLNICYKNQHRKIPINYGNTPLYPSLFLHDITGDGIEEVFIGEFFVDGRYSANGFITNSVYSILMP